jgi:hypothetical protein
MNIKKITILITICLSVLLTTFAQQNDEVFQYVIKQDSSYFFIDNTRNNWYTFTIKTDTMFHIEENIYYFGNDKTIQVGSVYFDSEKMNPISVFAFQKSNKCNSKFLTDRANKVEPCPNVRVVQPAANGGST